MNNDSRPYFELPQKIEDFELIELLGKGSFSQVYKAKSLRQLNGQNYVGIKVILKKNLNQDGDTERLHREIDAMSSLTHENIVKLHKFFEDNLFYYLVMDFCAGGTVYNYISSGNRLREPQAAIIFKQIVEAVDYCHNNNFAHRDLKLQNILFTTFPNIKLCDFGLCGYVNDDTKLSTFCGSPCYSAPECINHIDYDGKLSDIWSLGVILFELVTNSHPWNVENVPQMIQQITNGQYTIPSYVTSACADLIESMLIVNSAERLDIESILIHPWLKIASKRSPVSETAAAAASHFESEKSNIEENEPTNVNDKMNGQTDKTSLPPLHRVVSSCGKDVQNENKNGLSILIPHSTVNVNHFDLTPKMRIPLGSRTMGQSIPSHLKRRISMNKNFAPSEEIAKLQSQFKKKRAHESLDSPILKW